MDSSLVFHILNVMTAIIAFAAMQRVRTLSRKIQDSKAKVEMFVAGLRVVEHAIEDNKDCLSRTGAGDRVARTIRTYGPAAEQVVDSARTAAASLREEAIAARRTVRPCLEQEASDG